jgi:MYXO-CTERM domain-containing protein
VNAAPELLTDGLVLHLEADSGVTVTDMTTDVVTWADQSAQGNDLTAAGAPQLVADALNGQPVIAFDGIDDVLQRTADIMGLPAGDADRTMFLVVRYDSEGFGGAAYGNAGVSNEVFGLIVSGRRADAGNLAVQAWGANDAFSATLGTGAGWMIQSVVAGSGAMTHYRDIVGEESMMIDMQSRTYATNVVSLVVGAEIDGAPFMDMDVAAVLIYGRALSDVERGEVETYLNTKYFDGVDIDITAPAEGENVASGDVVVTYESFGTAFDQVRLVLDGGTPVDLAEASGSYTFTGVASGAHVLTATLLDDMGQPLMDAAATETVNFTADDCLPDTFGPNCTVDTDGDGTPDSVETETADTDSDGTPDYLESSVTDSDGDGFADQADRANNDQCIPVDSGPGCGTVTPPPTSSGGGGSFSLAWMLALSGLLAMRRRRYDSV